MTEIDLTLIFKMMLYFFTALISSFLLPWIHAKFSAEETASFLRWVEIGVAAAEQLYRDFEGEEKKKYVIAYLKKKGYRANVEEIETAIEAAVLHLHAQLYKETDDVEQP